MPWLATAENAVAGLVLAAMVALPLLAMVARTAPGAGLAYATPIVRHLNLWLACLGAALAARDGRLLGLATETFLPAGAAKRAAAILRSAVGTAVSALLARASFDLLVLEKEFGTDVIPGLPLWVVLLVLPLAFGLIALRLAWNAGPRAVDRILAGAGIALGLWIGASPGLVEGAPAWPGIAVLVLAAILGAPIFVALGGAGLWLFLVDGIPAEAVPGEVYRLASSPFLAAIPLFTLSGYLLTQGSAPARLVALFRAWLGWLPGGSAVVSVFACSFLTTFTGGSGVTILALGGLLFSALRQDGYRERFSLGLLTGTGSLGLLFPPALPLILYAISAEVAVEDVFRAGLLPGVVMTLFAGLLAVREGMRSGVQRTPFRAVDALAALRGAAWELSIPVVALVAIFGGFATLVEAAALTAAHALAIQVVARREIAPSGLLAVSTDCVATLGGVLVILTAAMGLTSYLVDAEVPAHLLDWVQAHVGSRTVFLLGLNVFLLLVGCFMDIYSAIIVVVPLILPLARAYGVDPVHLGIVFVANLELGYLTPPVGLNLFVASYRFDRPLLEVTRAALPFLLILAIAVLLITYLPFLSTALL